MKNAAALMLLAFVLIAGSPTLSSAETITISSTNFVPVQTSFALELGQWYLLEIGGAYTYAPGGRIADAEFAYEPDSGTWLEELPGVTQQEINLDVLINGVSTNWLGTVDGVNFAPHTYSPTHVYRQYIQGLGLPISLVVYDSSYDHNEGSLKATITAVPEPSSLLLLGAALFGLTVLRRQRFA
jgi:PEP-CTERM motif-containing protein